MAEEKKIWDESIAVFWTSFASTVEDATIVAFFGDSYQEPLPQELLLDSVVAKLRERSWSFNTDPSCEVARTVMRDDCISLGLMNCEETVGVFWDEFETSLEDATFVDLFCKSYEGDELLDSRFLAEFAAKLKSSDWSLKTDLSCEVPKKLMYDMATNLQKKPWEHFREAIKLFWEKLETASDDATSLASFCASYTTEPRFPEGFLHKFMDSLQSETASWNLNDDPTYEKPKELMDNLFKKAKQKMRKKASKIRKREEKREEDKVDEILAMEMVQNINITETEEPPIITTQEEIDQNIQNMKARKELHEAQQRQIRKERKDVIRTIQRGKKRDGQTINMANQLSLGLRNHGEEERLFGGASGSRGGDN